MHTDIDRDRKRQDNHLHIVLLSLTSQYLWAQKQMTSIRNLLTFERLGWSRKKDVTNQRS